jgi:hypothetical protein
MQTLTSDFVSIDLLHHIDHHLEDNYRWKDGNVVWWDPLKAECSNGM